VSAATPALAAPPCPRRAAKPDSPGAREGTTRTHRPHASTSVQHRKKGRRASALERGGLGADLLMRWATIVLLEVVDPAAPRATVQTSVPVETRVRGKDPPHVLRLRWIWVSRQRRRREHCEPPGGGSEAWPLCSVFRRQTDTAALLTPALGDSNDEEQARPRTPWSLLHFAQSASGGSMRR